ncbi:type II secretion system minor pseudopilin GspK [Vibrio sp. S9_S30]|uniref:type II secretion system minor pseudopilin GspK n=1 Tax=Vibrio sp. S9_S30 TaxID=2720226 RepID=UPI0016816751|nr:type II secretion system minor pseudopilin GspK [Vibrio sp. S9_S30]
MVKRSPQSGVALIVVLLLLAVMTAIAASMSERLFINFHRAGNQVNHQQAYWYSLGVEALAKAGIEQSYKDNETINLSQPWALKEQTYPLDYGTAKGKLVDMQACFNINVLTSVKSRVETAQKPFLVKVWQNLIEQQDIEPYIAEVIADSSWDFVDNDTNVLTSYGAEDSIYEGFQPPYLTANGFLADRSELRAIQQVSAPIMDKLSPLVCALPTNEWKLNVNTISEDQADILAALFQPHLSSSNAKELIANRKFDGWDSVDNFMSEPVINGIEEKVRKEAQAHIAVDSRYFELDAQVMVDESRVRIRSLLYSKDRKQATVVRRSFGGISERVSDRKSK